MARRNRGLVRAGVAVCLAVCVASGPVRAQQDQQAPNASPFAPGDLKRPVFDTQTPTYNMDDKQAKSANIVVAEVDGRAVTLGDVGDAIRRLPANVAALPFADLFPGVLAQLVRQEALVIRAQRQALDEDPAVRRQVKAASEQVLANELLTREIAGTITEAALLDRYNTQVVGKPGPEEVHLRVISVKTEAEATAIIGELKAGADFAALATRSSKDPTAQVGGDAGFTTVERLTPEVGPVAFSLQPGQFTAFPVRGPDSWFVLKVEERRHAPVLPFSAMRETLRQAMMREGVADVVKAAMADVTVREYDINGKEADESAAGSGAREVK